VNHPHQTTSTTAQLGEQLAALSSDAGACARLELLLQPAFPSIPEGLPAAVLMVVAQTLQKKSPKSLFRLSDIQQSVYHLECRIEALAVLVNHLAKMSQCNESIQNGADLLFNDLIADTRNLDMSLHIFASMR